MSYPLGTKIGAPLTNGDAQATFGTHIDYLGVGGFRSVPTIADRNAIPVKDAVEYDAGGSGMRREGMIVYCQDTKKTYQLVIPNYSALPDADKLVQLNNNLNWKNIQFGVVADGEYIVDVTYDPATFTFTIITNVTTRSFVLGSDVDKAYVDAADASLQSQIDTIVNGAPSALDTLKEIADQIAADEAGVAAILATQQQHTQQINSLLTPRYITITYADALSIVTTKDVNNKLAVTSIYRITDRPLQGTGTTGDVLVQAIGDFEFAPDGILLTSVPDYNTYPSWIPNQSVAAVPFVHLGKTWIITDGGDSLQEPGTTGDWVINPAGDTNGNTIRENDSIEYIIETDWISKRSDKRGNVVSNTYTNAINNGYNTPYTIDQWLWGNDYCTSNTVIDSLFQKTILTNSQYSNVVGNTFVYSQFYNTSFQYYGNPSSPNLQYNTMKNVTFQNVTLMNIATTTIDGGLIYYCDYLNLDSCVFTSSYVYGFGTVSPPVTVNFSTIQLNNCYLASTSPYPYDVYLSNNIFTGSVYLNYDERPSNEIRGYNLKSSGGGGANNVIIYKDGVAPQETNLYLGIGNGDTTPHDLIEIFGSFGNLYLKNQDYNISGYNAIVNSVWIVDGGVGRKITVNGVTSKGTWFIHESYDDGTPNGIVANFNRCTIPTLMSFQAASGGARDRHTFTNCKIGRVGRAAAYNGHSGHTLTFDQCTFGDGVTSGNLVGDYVNGEMSARFNACLFRLSGSAQVGPADTVNSVYPYLQFHNCTVVRADGTSYVLDNAGTVGLGTGSGVGVDEYEVSDTIRTAVVTGTYNSSNELTTPVADSVTGMKFSYQSYSYEYMPGDAGTLVWIRNKKTGGSGGTVEPTPPANFTGAVAPYVVRTEYAFDKGWWVSTAGSNNRVSSTYNGGDNFVSVNGSGSSYSEYVGATQTWQLKPLWCKRIDCYYSTRPFTHNLLLKVYKASDPTTVVAQQTIIFDNPSMFRNAGGTDKLTPNHRFFLPTTDVYILEVITIPTTDTTTGNPTNFWEHGNYMIY